MTEHADAGRGLALKWAWSTDDAVSCLLSVANGAPWAAWMQHETDTRGIVTERAAKAIREALAYQRAGQPGGEGE